MPLRLRGLSSPTRWLAIGTLGLGFMLGQVVDGWPAQGAGARPADASPAAADAFCTPAAEPTSTPAPTPTATPVPPKAIGEPLPYLSTWSVVVTGLSLTPSLLSENADGIFAVVGLTIENRGITAEAFPLFELRLVDAAGRAFSPAVAPTIRANTRHPYNAIDPGMSQDAVLVFDVAADAGEVFILESDEDPTFRVRLTPTRLG